VPLFCSCKMELITSVLQSAMKRKGLHVYEAASYSRECNTETEWKRKNNSLLDS